MSSSSSMSRYNEVIKKEIELIYKFREYCLTNLKLDSFFSSIVSKHPWNDVCVIVWGAFALGVLEYGSSHFWIGTMNLCASYLLNQLLRASRPVEFNENFQPLTDTLADSYGFPSIESHMSIVVFGHLIYISQKWYLLPIGLILVAIIGISRVYSMSRFPHQIVGSWITGLIGLPLAMKCCHHMSFHEMDDFFHNTCVFVVIACLVCNFALAVEGNQSRLVGIKKNEFLRVIVGIMGSSVAKSSYEDAVSKRQADTRTSSKMRSKLEKRDSFYFLQKTLMEEDAALKREKKLT